MKFPILVTGSHRSGSTWVGKVLSASPNTHFVAEPFNLIHAKQCPDIPISYWFQAVNSHDEDLFHYYLTHKIGILYRPSFLAVDTPLWESIYRHGISYSKCFLRHLIQRQPIVKDPIAFFSAEWFAERFQAKVVILIRHPAAFVNSLQRANWAFPFEHLLRQPELMEQKLSAFQAEISRYAEQPPDLIDQGILLWRIFHHTIAHYQTQHPDWIFVRHEDLSRSPLPAFQHLFQQLDLPFTQSVQAKIAEYNTSSPEMNQKSHHQLHRDSRANIWAWRSHLSPADIDRIREGVADISYRFYSDREWFPDTDV